MPSGPPSALHLTSVHTPDDTRIFHRELTTLARSGWRVALAAPVAESVEIDGVDVIGVGTANSRLSRVFRMSWRLLRVALKRRDDICHFHDPELIPLGIVLRACGRKVVYDVHEDYPVQILSKTWIPSVLRRPISWLMAGLEWLGRVLLSGIVIAGPVLSPRFGSPKTAMVCNFPSLEEFGDPLPYGSGEGSAVYVGGLSIVRGAREMVRAMALVGTPDAKLQLAGTFRPEGLLDDLATEPGWEKVEHLGQVGRPEAVRLVKSARVGVVVLHPLPNYIPALPIKMYEYMAAGIPVVASSGTLWGDTIKELRCGLVVDPLDPQAIADAIDSLLADATTAAAMGARGRAAVEKDFSWEAQGAELVGLYERIAPRDVAG